MARRTSSPSFACSRRDFGRRSACIVAAVACTLVLGLLPGLDPAAEAGGIQTNRGPNEAAPRQSLDPQQDTPAARMPLYGGGEDEQLEQELHQLEQRVMAAWQSWETANANYTRARHRRNYRGTVLNQMLGDVQRAARERDEAEDEFLRKVEEARRAGLPAGSMARYLDLSELIERGRAQRASER